MGTVLCLVDNSRDAGEALRAAADFSREAGLRLVAVHVVHPVTRGTDEALRAKREGRRFLDRIITNVGLDRSVDRRVEIGEPARELARVASEEAASLIVVNAQSNHWWRPEPVDDLAGDLAATAPCPVVVAPRQRGR